MSEYKILEPAEAVRDSISRLWSNKDWIAEEKCDGHRYLAHFGGPCSRLYMVSRRDNESGRNVPQFDPKIKLGYTVLDGEIIPPEGNQFYDLASYLHVSPQSAQFQRKLTGEVKYKVFDILFLNGQDVRHLPLEKRIQLLNVLMEHVFPKNPLVSQVNRVFEGTHDYFNQIIESGGEGIVLKNLKSTYGAGWYKGKRNSTLDVFVCGFEPGYDCQYGAFKIGVLKDNKPIEVGKCGIVDPYVRNHVNLNHMAYVGKVIEIKCMKFDISSGKVREPIFVRMRPDLSPLKVTWEKMLNDNRIVNID